jgi:hypothetical protein
MKSNQSFDLIGVLLMLTLGGVTACAPVTPRLDAHFGEAVGVARAQQTVNPEASLNTEPLEGIDGQAGDAMVDNYRNSFRNPQPPSRGAIDVGTTGASGGQ